MSSNPGRVRPLSSDELSAEQQAAAGAWKDLSFTRVLLRHPRRYRTFVAHMGALVRETSLPARDRELVILRILGLCGDTYEQAHHRVIARGVGLTATEIDAACSGNGDGLDEHHGVLSRAVEELHRHQCIADDTWTTLGKTYTLEQQMEVVYLTGCFQTVAMLTKTFGMELEPDFERFDAMRGRSSHQ